MKIPNLEKMPLDELWALHETIQSALIEKLTNEKHALEQRLADLKLIGREPRAAVRRRRPYPKVLPKFWNPQKRSQTWSGRGKTPIWFKALVDAGTSIEEMQIPEGGMN